MQTKWYIRSLIILLALVGISLEQITVPNQQIVVEFASDEVSLTDAQETIAAVKNQLQTIGAENIQVQETAEGRLKITYYSAIDTIAIKDLLSFDNDVAIGDTSQNNTPSNEASVYKLDVHEIQQQPDVDLDLNGLVFELESKTHRYFVPDVSVSLHQLQVTERNKIEKVAYTLQSDQTLGIDNFSYKIPEVRAGPSVSGFLAIRNIRISEDVMVLFTVS
jgi:hypothetical protein